SRSRSPSFPARCTQARSGWGLGSTASAGRPTASRCRCSRCRPRWRRAAGSPRPLPKRTTRRERRAVAGRNARRACATWVEAPDPGFPQRTKRHTLMDTSPRRNDLVFQLSLTELAFTVAFLLLLLSAVLVGRAERERDALRQALSSAQEELA